MGLTQWEGETEREKLCAHLKRCAMDPFPCQSEIEYEIFKVIHITLNTPRMEHLNSVSNIQSF